MSYVWKDVGTLWDRLFDHRGFLSGEISFMLSEFELKRMDKEVDTIFSVIENIREIQDIQTNRLKQIEDKVEKINEELEGALDVCNKFIELDKSIKQDTTIEESRKERKILLNRFMDDITNEYSKINSTFEAKEKEVAKLFEDIEKKLLI